MAENSSVKRRSEGNEGNEEKRVLFPTGILTAKDIRNDKDLRKAIIEQVDTEYLMAFDNTEAKRKENLRRLKLYNNQKRDQSKVGDPLLFSIFNTVLAPLYTDKLDSLWEGREEGDEEVAENLTAMAEHDYVLMDKDRMDYDWIWDTMFFGKGFVLMNDFDRENMVPCPEVIDPMAMVRDPRAASINGNLRGVGGAKFFGMEVGLSRDQMEKHPAYFWLGGLKKESDRRRGLRKESRDERDAAQGRETFRDREESLDENYEFGVLRWFTHINGQKYVIELANNRSRIVRFQALKGIRWPILERQIFPMAHDFDGVSIPDLIEDKQRARSVMINLGLESAKADLYPMYLFNKKKIKNERDLDFEFNKMVPVDGDVNNAITPMQKSTFHQQVNLIMNLLNTAAQQATAAPETAQGINPREDRTLGENELVAMGTGIRRSLSARIFGWSEKDFWRQWYWLYKQNFKDEIDEKVIRLVGPLGPLWRTLTKENIVSQTTDPDVFVESNADAIQRRRDEFASFQAVVQTIVQDPEANRRYAEKKLAKISGMRKQEIDMLLPPTFDELHSQDENVLIDDNKLPDVDFSDDDIVHVQIHNKASDTKAKLAHIEAHKKMMQFKKKRPDLVPPEVAPQVTPIQSPQQAVPRAQAVVGGGKATAEPSAEPTV